MKKRITDRGIGSGLEQGLRACSSNPPWLLYGVLLESSSRPPFSNLDIWKEREGDEGTQFLEA
jgi:hypothetical protein